MGEGWIWIMIKSTS